MLLVRLNVSLRAHDYAATPRFVCIPDALQAHDIGTRREVGPLHIHHQIVNRQIRIIHIGHTGVNHLAQVMGGNIRSHTHCDASSTIHQQVGNPCGHNRRLHQCVVEVCGHIHRFLLQVVHHGLAHQREPGLGITHGGWAVAIHRSEVALSVNQCVSHAPLLSHTNQGAIYRAVTVGMILTKHLTHDTCAFLVWLAV